MWLKSCRNLLRGSSWVVAGKPRGGASQKVVIFHISNPLEVIHTMNHKLIAVAQEAFKVEREVELPRFKAGDTVTVTIRIREGNKERLQNFRGVVLQRRGVGATETFTIRKMSDNIGVERIFPVNSPTIVKIELNKVGVVRRARIFYLRDLTGKKARIKERKFVSKKA